MGGNGGYAADRPRGAVAAAAGRSPADRDLEAVLMKTLARDPEQRYATAGGLAADLERYLKGEPLVARPPTIGYLLRKRLRKHHKPILLGMLFVALIGLIAGYAAWDYYAQWGGWTEVVRYDFTRPDATLDGLGFRDPDTSLPAPPWFVEGGGLVPEVRRVVCAQRGSRPGRRAVGAKGALQFRA